MDTRRRAGTVRQPTRQTIVGHGNVPLVVISADTVAPTRTTGVLPWVALGVVYVMWGTTFLGTRLIITEVPPLLVGSVRFLLGGALLAVAVVAVAGRYAFRMTKAQLGTTVLSGMLLPA